MTRWGFTPLALPAEEPGEREKVERAADCCREILHHVNQAVRDMEDLLVSPGMARDILSACSEVRHSLCSLGVSVQGSFIP